MPRPTKAQIDAEIVDSAAALFAKHGFADTSVQQIADAVGYSKSGLLQRFPSKDALYQAALAALDAQAAEVLRVAEALPAGPARDRAAVEAGVDLAFAGPGVSALLHSIVPADLSLSPELAEVSRKMAIAFGIYGPDVDHDRLVKVVSASGGLGVATLAAVRVQHTREWRGPIIEAAMRALGH